MRRALLLVAWVLVAGCARSGETVLGAAPPAGPVSLVQDLKAARQATLRGIMYEKCPVAGCWFMLRDSSGAIRVDTKAAGFTVTDVPVNAEVTVFGTAKRTGQEAILAADGMRY